MGNLLDHLLPLCSNIKGHRLIVTEQDGGEAHKLMCSYCCGIVKYKDIKRAQKMQIVFGEVIDLESE